jgi:hypothetical protein
MLFFQFESYIALKRISSDKLILNTTLMEYQSCCCCCCCLYWLILWTNFFLIYPSAEGLFDQCIVHQLSQMQHFKITLLTEEELSWQKKALLTWLQESLCLKTMLLIRYVAVLTYFRRLKSVTLLFGSFT